MKFMFLGDLISEDTVYVIEKNLHDIIKNNNLDLVFCNAENVEDGRGLSIINYNKLINAGINFITMGNHTFDIKENYVTLEESKIIRPYNLYTKIGKGYKYFKYKGKNICILNLIGNLYMKNSLNLYQSINTFLQTNKNKFDYLIVDIHAQAQSEKRLTAEMLDGIATCVVGTHTHVQTADEQILDKGTFFITDLGMCGVYNSIIGFNKKNCYDVFVSKEIKKIGIQKGNITLQGVIIDTEQNSIKRYKEEFLCEK